MTVTVGKTKKEVKEMISREDACRTLIELVNSGIFSDEISDALEEIRLCIEAEQDRNIFLWGAKEEDWAELYTSRMNPYKSSAPYNTDLLKKEFDEWRSLCDEIYEKYKIRSLETEVSSIGRAIG